MPPRRHQLVASLVFLAVIVVSRWRVEAQFQWRYPAMTELVVTEHFPGDIGALLLGAHRVAADISYIQWLQYYGVERPEEDSAKEHSEGDGHAPTEEERLFEGGVFPRLLELGTRTLRLDPFFNGAALEAAGALAFIQKRTDEAVSLLTEAIHRDPAFYRYHLYMGAILYRSQGNDAKLIDTLKEAITYDDCPAMLENVLGNLLKRYGRYVEAAQVYLHTYETAPSADDRNTAATRLKQLFAEHPELARQIPLPGQ